MAEDSKLLRLPTEVRMMIYEYLLDGKGSSSIEIRNKASSLLQRGNGPKLRRSTYHVLERSMLRRSYETTYCVAGGRKMHPAILAVNHKIREEASHYLYGTHSFDFGRDIESVVPFFHDRTPRTRELVKEICLRKRGSVGTMEADSYEWAAVCRFLKTLPKLTRLRLVVEGGLPRQDWGGPKELSTSDLRLLCSTRHGSLDWARQLAEVKTIEKVEIVADIHYLSEPRTASMFIFAALSGSIETSLVEFLKTDLDIPAVAGSMKAEQQAP